MVFLANENFPFDAVVALRGLGHDVKWVRTDAPGVGDEEVLRMAREGNRVLITFDKDFGELVFRSTLAAPPGLILFRIPTPSSSYIARIVVEAIKSRTDWEGHFSVVEVNRIRMKLLPTE